MSTYEPGTVAVATVRGVPNVRVFHWDRSVSKWLSATPVDGTCIHSIGHVTDVRPLVVLDLEDSAEAVRHLRAVAGSWDVVEDIADQIEAQTQSPRIPEPTGFAPIVEAGVDQHDQRLRWVQNHRGYWVCEDRDEYDRLWSELVNPVLVRDGIEETS